MDNQEKETGCCPRFDPSPWDNKTFEWTDKRFVKAKVKTFFFVPLNFGSVITKTYDKITKAGATVMDRMSLSNHTSNWNMDLYIAVDREIPDAENVTLSGKFFSKIYEGNFNETGKWSKDFENDLKSRKLEIKKWYMWYTTCPQCAKKYGKNYVVIIAEI